MGAIQIQWYNNQLNLLLSPSVNAFKRLPREHLGYDKLETYFHDPCSNQPSYEGSRLTMAKIVNKDVICRLDSVAELEIINL